MRGVLTCRRLRVRGEMSSGNAFRKGGMTMAEGAEPRTVGILIFPDVEILDFCGPFEVFASAAAPGETDGGANRKLFTAITIAEHPDIVPCRGGLLVQPNYTLSDHPPLDIVVIPGGYGTEPLMKNPVVLDWIARQRQGGALTTSVCTGAFLLGAAGLLDGIRATSHWATIDNLRALMPNTDVRADVRVVDEGEIITSAGVSAGIDMALHVVRRLHGDEVARITARDMEYEGEAAVSDLPQPMPLAPDGLSLGGTRLLPQRSNEMSES
jgi:transcriptional regulator GlxA family with amidase domain